MEMSQGIEFNLVFTTSAIPTPLPSFLNNIVYVFVYKFVSNDFLLFSCNEFLKLDNSKISDFEEQRIQY